MAHAGGSDCQAILLGESVLFSKRAVLMAVALAMVEVT
ncbi:hypothetical protein SpAn4DRAFT_3910 [Sporomusa ovata]|uniref:Uncharacterized protein n=1 Tax=Sporomusa ovata TaxID=2378 RepID=A0A0U1KVV0_9FIRM|nr:hypothetical protein SpAn4DRAFT_3910 [Sporomusa ovata]